MASARSLCEKTTWLLAYSAIVLPLSTLARKSLGSNGDSCFGFNCALMLPSILSASYSFLADSPLALWPQGNQLRLAASWHGQLGHRFALKQPQVRFRQQAGPAIRALPPCAVGRNTGVGVHLAIELRDEQERQARL